MAATVSVIVPVFNGEAFLGDAIESALAQTYAPLEIIVLDDGSTDGTAGVARSLPVTYVHRENAGVSVARNTAISLSRGDLVALLDADDVWLPEKLERQVLKLADDAGAGYVSCSYHFSYAPAMKPPSWFPPPWQRDGRIPSTTEIATGYAIPSTWVIRHETWERVGPFNESYYTGEDIDWLSRAKGLGIKTAYVPEPLLLKRFHEANLSSCITGDGGKFWLEQVRSALAMKRAAGA